MIRQVTSLIKEVTSASDLFCQPFNLYYNSASSYSSPLGTCSSLLIHAICIFTFGSLSIQLFQYSDPNIVSRIISNLEPEKITLTPDNFFLGLGIVDQDGLPIANNATHMYYYVRLAFAFETNTIDKKGLPSHNLTIHDVQMVPCLQTNLSQETIDTFGGKLAVMYCPNVSDWQNKTEYTYLQGLVTSQQVTYLFLRVYPCTPPFSTDYQIDNCAPQQLVEDRLSFAYMVTGFTDYLLDQSKPGNPYSQVFKISTTLVKYGTKTSFQQILRHSYFSSEINFFHYFPQFENYHILTLQSQSSQQTANNYSIFEMIFLIDDRQEQFQRSYSTFFDILGNIGGIQSFLVLIVGVFVNPIIQQSQQIDLINNTFDVEIDNQKEHRDGGKGQLRIGLLERLPLVCFGRKRKIIRRGHDEIMRYLDVGNLIKKINSLDQLKKILLDDHQLRVFNYAADPKIVSYKAGIHQDPTVYNDEKSSCIDQYSLAFRRLATSQNAIDQKILTMIKPGLLRKLQKVATPTDMPSISPETKMGRKQKELMHPYPDLEYIEEYQ